MSDTFTNEDLLAFTTEIVSSHVANNETTAAQIDSGRLPRFGVRQRAGTRRREIEARGSRQGIRFSGLPRLLGRRQKIENAETPPENGVQHDAG